MNKHGFHQKDSISDFSGGWLGSFQQVLETVYGRRDNVLGRNISCLMFAQKPNCII